MRIALFIRALKAWWQHAWRSTVRTFHLFIAFLFFVFAILAGQKAFLAWRNYENRPRRGIMVVLRDGRSLRDARHLRALFHAESARCALAPRSD